MNRKLPGFIFYPAIIVYLVALGFLRDYFFVNINYQMAKLYYHDEFDYHLPQAMMWLENFSYTRLYYGKFLLTFIFTLLYLAPALLIVRRLFPGKQYLQWTLLSHSAVFAFSLLVFLFGKITGLYEQCYSIARFFSGILESPLMLMLLVVAFSISRLGKKGVHP